MFLKSLRYNRGPLRRCGNKLSTSTIKFPRQGLLRFPKGVWRFWDGSLNELKKFKFYTEVEKIVGSDASQAVTGARVLFCGSPFPVGHFLAFARLV